MELSDEESASLVGYGAGIRLRQTAYRRCSRKSLMTLGLYIPRVKYSVLYFYRRLGHEKTAA
jgi:hypothetical protein